MFILYIIVPISLPIFILAVKAKKTKETQRQRAAWEERLAAFSPVVLRNVAVNKEVVSGKIYYPTEIKQCDLFVLSNSIIMLAKKESWRYPDMTATHLAKQPDNLLPEMNENVMIQSVTITKSDNGSKTLRIEGKDANVILRTYTISLYALSDDQLQTLQTAECV